MTETENHPLRGWTTKQLYLKKYLFDKTELFRPHPYRKGIFFMAKEKNLAHPKWLLGKSSLINFDKFCQLKYRYDNQRSWSVGYYVSSVQSKEGNR